MTKAEILGGVPNSIIVSTSQATPSTISGMVLVVERGLELQVDNSIKNITGRTINLFGTISYHPDNTSATSVLNMCVQRSTDNGVSWVNEPFSGFTVEVANSNESYSTKSTGISGLNDSELFRFVFYETGTGGITLDPTNFQMEGNPVDGASLSIHLTE